MRILLAALCLVSGVSRAEEKTSLEVLHWWTSGGEAKSLQVLKNEFEASGYQWKDTPIAGGGGDTARSILKTRFVQKHPPAVAQLHQGAQVNEWGKEGVLQDVDDVAKSGQWEKHLPQFLTEGIKSSGKTVAVPVNIHRQNWLWINPKVMEKHQLKVPTTWIEFNDVAAKLKAKGVIALAHGGQPWQDFVLFEDVALGVGGADYFRKAFLELDEKTLASETTKNVLIQFRKLKEFTDKGSAGRDWNLATSMVVRGEAAMQLMGDWAKGELVAQNVKPGKDILCVPAPGTQGTFAANNDSFVFFKTKDIKQEAAQKKLAALVMSDKFQRDFNFVKGSIPANLSVSLKGFDPCAMASHQDLKEATASGRVLPIINNGVNESIVGALMDVVTEYFNSDIAPEKTVAKLATAAKSVQL